MLLLITLLAAAVWAVTPPPVRYFEPQQISLPNGGSLAVSADLNGDGYTDLAFIATGGLELLLSNGKGGFQSPVLLSLPNTVSAAAAGDFNGDGVSDLVVAMNGVFFLPGTGGGSFGSPVLISNSGGLMAAADFNRDGKLDMAYASLDSNTSTVTVAILLGNGDGTFQAGGQWTDPNHLVTSLSVADFNADGNPDLLTITSDISYGGSHGMILFGDGHGNLSSGPAVAILAYNNPEFAIADVNGDGVPDLVVPLPPVDSGGIEVLLGNGDGTFRKAPFLPTGVLIKALVTADVNGDGKLDVAAFTVDDSLIIMYGNGDGTFTRGPECVASIQPWANQHTVLAALSQPSGTLGFATTGYISPLSYYEYGVTVLRLRNGSLDSPRLLQTGYKSYGMVTGDFNHDGKLDLATSAPTGLAVLLGNGDGTFRKPVVSAGFPGYYPIAVADFNQDGILDVMVSNNSTTYEQAIFFGNGDGTFTPAAAPVLFAAYVAIADVNGDGIPDAVTGTPLTVYLGNGDGTFGSAIATKYSSNVPYVFADFNGDGKLDVAADYSSNESFVFLGNGDGTFRAPLVVTGLTVAAAADLNGDGIPDLAGYAVSTTGIAVEFGHGDGTFSAPVTYPLQPMEFNFLSSMTIADWNGDGHLDIAAMPTSSGYSYTYFFLGDGTGNFTVQPNGILLYPSFYFAVGDFNGDGLPDVASAADAIWVLRNTSR